jgi:hypothetical protein
MVMSDTEQSHLLSALYAASRPRLPRAPWPQVRPDDNTRTIATNDMGAILAAHATVDPFAQPSSDAEQTLVFLGPEPNGNFANVLTRGGCLLPPSLPVLASAADHVTRRALETVSEECFRCPTLVVTRELEDVVLLRGLGIAATLASGLDRFDRAGLQGLKQALDWSDESGDRVDLVLCNCALAACAQSTTDWQDVQRRIRAIQRLGLDPHVYLWTPTSQQLEDLRLLQSLGEAKWLRSFLATSLAKTDDPVHEPYRRPVPADYAAAREACVAQRKLRGHVQEAAQDLEAVAERELVGALDGTAKGQQKALTGMLQFVMRRLTQLLVAADLQHLQVDEAHRRPPSAEEFQSIANWVRLVCNLSREITQCTPRSKKTRGRQRRAGLSISGLGRLRLRN